MLPASLAIRSSLPFDYVFHVTRMATLSWNNTMCQNFLNIMLRYARAISDFSCHPLANLNVARLGPMYPTARVCGVIGCCPVAISNRLAPVDSLISLPLWDVHSSSLGYEHPILKPKSAGLALTFELHQTLGLWVMLKSLLYSIDQRETWTCDGGQLSFSTQSISHEVSLRRLVLHHKVKFCQEVLPPSLLRSQLLLIEEVASGNIWDHACVTFLQDAHGVGEWNEHGLDSVQELHAKHYWIVIHCDDKEINRASPFPQTDRDALCNPKDLDREVMRSSTIYKGLSDSVTGLGFYKHTPISPILRHFYLSLNSTEELEGTYLRFLLLTKHLRGGFSPLLNSFDPLDGSGLFEIVLLWLPSPPLFPLPLLSLVFDLSGSLNSMRDSATKMAVAKDLQEHFSEILDIVSYSSLVLETPYLGSCLLLSIDRIELFHELFPELSLGVNGLSKAFTWPRHLSRVKFKAHCITSRSSSCPLLNSSMLWLTSSNLSSPYAMASSTLASLASASAKASLDLGLSFLPCFAPCSS
ncbi:uncharacterized protein G2W53_027082 [Senna tora]|uniref:Uncharacterized protein n=1 Tax=Senna tora TaxID=362788 RepID=A0A834TI22_9FABA|nr:uncharacterized protein G2W53_027082 [Senna tora]